jgi:hypothetical protein
MLAHRSHTNEEDDLRKAIILAIGGLVFLAGCGDVGSKAPNAPAPAKPKVPYRIEFDTKAAKPNPAGATLAAINYTANTQVLERRAVLVVRLDATEAKKVQSSMDQMIMGPVDIPDNAGTLPANYMDSANKGLAKMLGAACVKGTVKVNVVLVRSSIKPDAGESEINEKRLTEWLPTEVVFKNPHPKC